MITTVRRFIAHFVGFSLAVLLVSCGETNRDQSEISTADVPQTPVENQQIENCWAYAIAGWAESLHLKATGETVNISEAYWTYWEMYEELLTNHKVIKNIDTGSYWDGAKDFIVEHGLMYELDFSTENQQKLQEEAETAVNKELKRGGLLNKPENRTPENITTVLDNAFHVRMKDKASKVVALKDFVVGANSNSKQPRTLLEAFTDPSRMWKLYEYPYVEGKNKPTPEIIAERNKLLKRVMKAMNAGYPVMMGMMLDFKALNESNNTFEYARLIANRPKANNQGGHLTVLSDYTVKHAPDGHGGFMDVGEGPASEEVRNLAVDGTVTEFVIKNSWGPTTAEGIKSGYYRFEMDYLNASWPWFSEKHKKDIYTALGDFTLPPDFE